MVTPEPTNRFDSWVPFKLEFTVIWAVSAVNEANTGKVNGSKSFFIEE